MIAYHFDENKKYAGTIQCQIDPLTSELEGKEIYLLPANSTYKEPPEYKEGYEIIWNENSWEYSEVKKQDESAKYEPTEKEKKQMEIYKYQSELASYDYIGVKIAMGVATKEEYSEKIAYTETLRAKINELQSELNLIE